MLHGENQRAEVDADDLGKVLSEAGAKRLAGEQEVLLVIDESDLRKPYSRRLEYLDSVSDLSQASKKTLSLKTYAANVEPPPGGRAGSGQESFVSCPCSGLALNLGMISVCASYLF